MIAKVDSDNDGKIDFAEFLTLMSQQLASQISEEEIREAFRVFDRDSRGVIVVSELKHAMTTIGEPLTQQEAEDLFKMAGISSDGLLNYEEFMQTLLRKT